jgi:hypothetical protein
VVRREVWAEISTVPSAVRPFLRPLSIVWCGHRLLTPTHAPPLPRATFHTRGFVQSFANSSRCARHACPHTQTITPCSLCQQGARDDTRAPQEPPLHPLARHEGWWGGAEQERVSWQKGCRFPRTTFSLSSFQTAGWPKKDSNEREKPSHMCAVNHTTPPDSRKPKPRGKGPHLPAHHERTPPSPKPSWGKLFCDEAGIGSGAGTSESEVCVLLIHIRA